MAPEERTVEDIYPLSPMQEGMLFHSLFAGPAEAPLFQWKCRFEDGLDVEAFRRAWERVIERHSILRTAFLLDDVDEPLQVVFRAIELPWEERDLRDLPPAARAAELNAHLDRDRDARFDITAAPLMRFGVLRLDDKTFFFHWTVHLLLLDGWSTGLVLNEVLELYDAFRRGVEPRLERSRRYRDYIAWLQRQDRSSAEAFWRKTLEGISAPTPLVVARTVARSGATGSTEQRGTRLSASDTSRLQEFARRHRLTLNTLLRAAWALLLSRYSGEESVVFGATVAGRPTELDGVESIVGLFINTLPVRVEVPEDESLLGWLTRLQREQAELLLHQFSRLVDVQGWSDVPRGLPLFESILVVQTLPGGDRFRAAAARLALHEEENFERTNVPLTVKVIPGEEISFEASFDSDRFDTAAIDRMLSHFQNLLRRITETPEKRVGEIPLLTESEAHRVLVEWNATEVPDPRIESTLSHFFERQVDATPEATAVLFQDESLTYRQLNERANQLAHFLRESGVGPDVLVGVCMERSVEMVVALLAILKAGGAYVPLDPADPEARRAFVLENAGVSLILTQERLLETLGASAARKIAIDASWPEIARESRENLPARSGPHDLAYVIYTSGSTGKPKGVMIPHRGIANRLLWMQHQYRLTPEDRVLQKTPFGFDVSVWEFFWTLSNGATLVVALPGEHRDSGRLARVISERRITVIHFVPSMLQAFLQEKPRGCESLRLVICSGEALSWPLQEAFFARFGASLQNLYGPTEASVDVTFWSCERGSPRKIVPIGRPIWNTQLYVVDRRLRPLPVGVPGELYLGGVGLARGYVGRPDLTAERFVPSPFSRDGGRLYRTGDSVRYLEEGEVEYLGRLDGQVKIRGNRIELGEIEAALSQIPEVRDAVVVAREDEPGDQRLVAYVVPGSARERLAGECRDALRRVLPEYMIPSAFVLMDRIPLTASGKADRRALPAPDRARRETEQAFVPPRNAAEEVLAEIWSRVLKVPRVGVHDNFFDLGGHSLLATQVFARIRELTGVELPLRYLFENPTIAALAEHVEQARRGERVGEAPLKSVSRDADLPASFGQQRLWFLHQLEPGTSAYNARRALRLSGRLDRQALDRALTEIVTRHESLRTTFRDSAQGPIQVISAPSPVRVELHDLSAVPDERREEEARRHIQAEVARPFDLERGPVFRASLFRLERDEHILTLVVHHIVCDGWSIAVLFRELESLYGAFSRGEPSPLPPVPLQYADYALWERERLKGETLDRLLSYWVQQLRDATPVLDLKGDRPRPTVRTGGGGRHRFFIPAETGRGLAELGRAESVTLYMTLLAAYAVLLGRQTGQDQIVIGSPSSGRSRVETENVIGLFINTMVLRVDLAGNPSFRELLRRARETALGAYAHQELPFEKLVDALKLDRNLAHNPIFQVWFVLQNFEERPPDLSGLSVSEIPLETQATRHDLQLSISESSGGLDAQWDYAKDIFDPPTIASLARDFQVLLARIVERPNASIEELERSLDEAALLQEREKRDELEKESIEKLRTVKRKAVRQ